MTEKDFIKLLEKIGITTNSVDKEKNLGFYLQDSLTFLAFLVETEKFLKTELADSFFAEITYDTRVKDFITLINSLKL